MQLLMMRMDADPAAFQQLRDNALSGVVPEPLEVLWRQLQKCWYKLPTGALDPFLAARVWHRCDFNPADAICTAQPQLITSKDVYYLYVLLKNNTLLELPVHFNAWLCRFLNQHSGTAVSNEALAMVSWLKDVSNVNVARLVQPSMATALALAHVSKKQPALLEPFAADICSLVMQTGTLPGIPLVLHNMAVAFEPRLLEVCRSLPRPQVAALVQELPMFMLWKLVDVIAECATFNCYPICRMLYHNKLKTARSGVLTKALEHGCAAFTPLHGQVTVTCVHTMVYEVLRTGQLDFKHWHWLTQTSERLQTVLEERFPGQLKAPLAWARRRAFFVPLALRQKHPHGQPLLDPGLAHIAGDPGWAIVRHVVQFV